VNSVYSRASTKTSNNKINGVTTGKTAGSPQKRHATDDAIRYEHPHEIIVQ
jgi:hypothetical protein